MCSNLEMEITLLHNRICYGVADPNRVLILYSLEAGPKNVGELVAELSIRQSSVSKHLRVLRERSLVIAERRGPSVYYSLTDRRILDAMNLLREVLASQIETEQETMRGAT